MVLAYDDGVGASDALQKILLDYRIEGHFMVVCRKRNFHWMNLISLWWILPNIMLYLVFMYQINVHLL